MSSDTNTKIDGTYTWTRESGDPHNRVPHTWKLAIKSSGNTLSGQLTSFSAISGEERQSAVSSGTFTGDTIRIQVDVDPKTTIIFSGKLSDNTITGQMETTHGSTMTNRWVAKRA